MYFVVDDGSTDNTCQVVKKISNVRILTHSQNAGKGKALLSAINYAQKQKFRWIITMDGDGQHSPKHLKDFIHLIEKGGANLILGNRISRNSSMPFHRQLSNGITSIIISLFNGSKRIRDSQCGYRAIDLNYIKPSLYIEPGFQFESEILLNLSKTDCKIIELDIETKYGKESSSIHLFKDTLKFIRLIFRHLLRL